MIRHIWSVLCRESIINQDDNVISLLGVLEKLSVAFQSKDKTVTENSRFNIPINYEIVSFWVKSEKNSVAEAQVEYVLLGPEGREISKNTQNLIMPKDIKRLRTRLKISGMAINGSGDYIFRIGIKEKGQKVFKTVNEIPLEVNVQIEKSGSN